MCLLGPDSPPPPSTTLHGTLHGSCGTAPKVESAIEHGAIDLQPARQKMTDRSMGPHPKGRPQKYNTNNVHMAGQSCQTTLTTKMGGHFLIYISGHCTTAFSLLQPISIINLIKTILPLFMYMGLLPKHVCFARPLLFL